jgi:hypothetical protein
MVHQPNSIHWYAPSERQEQQRVDGSTEKYQQPFGTKIEIEEPLYDVNVEIAERFLDGKDIFSKREQQLEILQKCRIEEDKILVIPIGGNKEKFFWSE